VSCDAEHAQHGVIIDESVKQQKAATHRSPASTSQRAPSPRCRASAGAALQQCIDSKLRSALIDSSCRPGRDLKVFAELSRTPLPSKGSARFAIMAHGSSSCEGCSRILQARSVPLRSYKLQDNICFQDRFETAYCKR
jgi:hypothetical protein